MRRPTISLNLFRAASKELVTAAYAVGIAAHELFEKFVDYSMSVKLDPLTHMEICLAIVGSGLLFYKGLNTAQKLPAIQNVSADFEKFTKRRMQGALRWGVGTGLVVGIAIDETIKTLNFSGFKSFADTANFHAWGTLLTPPRISTAVLIVVGAAFGSIINERARSYFADVLAGPPRPLQNSQGNNHAPRGPS